MGKNSVNDDLLKNVCYQMVEEAKAMYKVTVTSRDSSPYDCSDSEIGSLGGENRLEQMVHSSHLLLFHITFFKCLLALFLEPFAL